MKEPLLFYIQDARTFVGNSVVWWCPNGKGYTTHIDPAGKDHRRAFGRLWGDINGEDSWKANPWVWAISFKRVDAQARAA